VPIELYEQDYRKVMDAWIDGVSKYIDVGSRTVAVKYIIDSKEFQDIVGKNINQKIHEWYKHIVSPQKTEGTWKGLRFLRNLQAFVILVFKYTVPIKQFLNMFDFWTMIPAKRMIISSLKVWGNSPTARLASYAGSIQERNLGFAVQDLKGAVMKWTKKPAQFTDKLTAKIGYIALLDQQIIRAKKQGKRITPKELKTMQKRADSIVDAVMGAMSAAETPAYFRTELGKTINMFYSQLNSKMQYYVRDIWKDPKMAEMSGNKKRLLAKSLVAILVAGFTENLINKLYFDDDWEDLGKDTLRQIAGNFPILGSIAFALETGQPYSPSPVLANIIKLISEISRGRAEEIFWASSGFAGFPKQLQNIIKGGVVIYKGGVYDKNGKFMFSVDTLPEKIRTLLKGKWGSREAQEYFEEKDIKIKSFSSAPSAPKPPSPPKPPRPPKF